MLLLLLLLICWAELQSGAIAEELHGLDRHDFASNPGMSEAQRQLPPPFKSKH
jgi:hypothetical protein